MWKSTLLNGIVVNSKRLKCHWAENVNSFHSHQTTMIILLMIHCFSLTNWKWVFNSMTTYIFYGLCNSTDYANIIKRAQNVGRKNIKREYVGEYNINSTDLIVHTYTKWYDHHWIFSIHYNYAQKWNETFKSII